MDANKELKTEVTSVAKEELKSGTTIELPEADQLIARASSSFLSNRKLLNSIITGNKASRGGRKPMGAKALVRVINAILDLPTNDIPVHLKSNEEKQAFIYGQSALQSRFTITYFHTIKEAKKAKELKDLKDSQLLKLNELKASGASEEQIKELEKKLEIEYNDLKNKLIKGDDSE